MDEVARLLNGMIENGVIRDYAIFGAIAQMRYTEAVATLDADILIAVPDADRIDLLSPVYEFCRQHGYIPEGDAIRIGTWPVQFIPAFDNLTKEALLNAETGDIDGIPLRVVRADYLAIIALSVGRAKDFTRILALLENNATNTDALSNLAETHGLSSQWLQFKRRFLDEHI